MDEQNTVIFREIQRPRQVWAWLLLLSIALLMWYIFIKQIFYGIPVGDNPAPNAVLIILWLVFGIAFPLCLVWFVRMITEVRKDGLYIRFVPFHIQYRSFLSKDIISYTSITYNTLTRFGGWGIRTSLEGEISYSMSGNSGVEIHLKGNQTVVIGSRKADELLKALNKLQEEKENT